MAVQAVAETHDTPLSETERFLVAAVSPVFHVGIRRQR
jgi:hypothetical protein